MNASFLVAIGDAHRENQGPSPHAVNLAYRALVNIQKILPTDRNGMRSVETFARDILAIPPLSGPANDMRLMLLLMGGNALSQDMKRFIEGLEKLTNDQKDALDALHTESQMRLVKFFDSIGHPEINAQFGGDLRTLDEDDLTQINGIGQSTARKLVEQGITNLGDLCAMTDEQQTAIHERLKLTPGQNPTEWRAQACRLIQGD